MKSWWKWLSLLPAIALGAAGGVYVNFQLFTTDLPNVQPKSPASTKPSPADPDREPVVGVPVVPLKSGVVVKPSSDTITEPTWTWNALGDVIIGRVVYRKITQHGVNYPFEKLGAQVRDADLTTADQESAISDAHTVICDTCMRFVSPDRVADGLTFAGIDAVSLANNHSYNGGQAGFINTMNSLTKRGIKYFGAGKNYNEAHTARIIEVKGVKVGLLGYNSIVGGYSATPTTAGMAEISLAPWEPFNEAEVKQMEQDIRAAAAVADVVAVQYHWGTEYTHMANEQQRKVGQRAIDAGADLVIGSHPHWVQGIEWYKDRLITYSLGNFVFDQEWSVKTKQGTYLKTKFIGSQMISAELVPYRIEDYSQPRPVSAAEAAQILSNIFAHSWWPKP